MFNVIKLHIFSLESRKNRTEPKKLLQWKWHKILKYMYSLESRNQEKWHRKSKLTFEGHISVSFRVFLMSVSPPTSSQPRSPAWCSGTFLMDAGVNPFMASSKSACVRIISGWGLSADCSGLLSNKQKGKWK